LNESDESFWSQLVSTLARVTPFLRHDFCRSRKTIFIFLVRTDRRPRVLHSDLGASDSADAPEEHDRRQRHRRAAAQGPAGRPHGLREQESQTGGAGGHTLCDTYMGVNVIMTIFCDLEQFSSQKLAILLKPKVCNYIFFKNCCALSKIDIFYSQFFA
jgi:hypothetical protein